MGVRLVGEARRKGIRDYLGARNRENGIGKACGKLGSRGD